MMTIGHSTLEIEVFLRVLAENGCRVLVDVRRFPGSRRYPWFGQAALFAAEIDWLVGLKELDRVTVMCAEAVPWRCHRSLIGDAVLARGVAVEDIFVEKDGRSSRRAHAMTEFARGEGARVWYPGEARLFL